MNRDEIMRLIPHRPPFLWLDEVVELSPTAVHARTLVTKDLDLFRGHYPAFPVLPGVIQCEMAFQASAVLIAALEPPRDGRVPVVARLNNVKFRRMVRPGETAEIRVALADRLKDTFYFTGTVGVGDAVAVRLDFAATAATVG